MRLRAASFAIALLLTGCAGAPPDSPPPPGASPTDTSHPTPTASNSAPFPPPSATPATTPPAPPVEPLTFIEEELAGTWTRVHIKNRNDDNEWRYWSYLAFLDNRTMCEWKHGQESSTDSDDDDYDYDQHGPWRVSEERGGGEYLVAAEGAGIEWVFDHSNDRLWLAGFSDLQYARATDGKTCYVR